MKTIIFIIGGIFVLLLFLFVYAAIFISGKHSEAEERRND